MRYRLKEIRKKLEMTQKEFGEKIGIAGATISDIERGKLALTDRNLNLICEKFNVSEDWLRAGQGEMFIVTQKKENIIDFRTRTINFFAMLEKLTDDEWDWLENKMKSMVESNTRIDKTLDNQTANNDKVEWSLDNEINKEMMNYKKELEIVKKNRTSSASEDTNVI